VCFSYCNNVKNLQKVISLTKCLNLSQAVNAD
jgi:hypothetical protein